MTKWEPLTRGGYECEIFAEREAYGMPCLYGRYKLRHWHPACWRASDGQGVDSLSLRSCDLIRADDTADNSVPDPIQDVDPDPSLRDQFAMAALTGVGGLSLHLDTVMTPQEVAKLVFAIADAMMEARKK